MSRRRAVAAGLAMVLALVVSGRASGRPVEVAEEGELDDLMAILEQETEVATKTRMNRDYVPGIVTVLERDELLALGIDTVGRALTLVPGIQVVRDLNGAPTLVVRGLDFPFNGGNVKVMLDGAQISRPTAGINGSVLDLPVDGIERIEVIRGPGSVVYGDFAFMGLVNVVSRKEGAGVYARADNQGALSAGGHGTFAAGDVAGSFAVSGTRARDEPLRRPVRADEDSIFGHLALGVGRFSLAVDLVDRDTGYANRNFVPGARERFAETSWLVDARYGWERSETLRSEARLRYLSTDLTTPIDDFDAGMLHLGYEVHWRRGPHSLLAGVDYEDEEIDRAFHFRAAPPPQPGMPPVPSSQYEIRDVGRRLASVSLQDQIAIAPRLELTVGGRYSDSSDAGSRLTPRLAIVWRASDRHIFKAQYAEGFRTPTFFELFGDRGSRNPGLDFEVNATSEIGYVFRRAEESFRLTLFHTELDDMIFVNRATLEFDNLAHARSEGFEAEYERQISARWKLKANASRVDTTDSRTPAAISDEDLAAADWLGNLALLYRPHARVVVGARWSHVGDRPAGAADGYDLVDLTLTLEDVGAPGLELRAGVDDLGGEDAVYVVPGPNGFNLLEQPSRTVWLRLAWRR